MFMTYRSSEIEIGKFLGEPDTQYWGITELSFFCCWFLVAAVHKQRKESYRRTFLVTSTQELEQMLSSVNSKFWVTDVQIATPNYMNGGERWKMEPLLQARLCVDDQADYQMLIYEVEGGKTYEDSSGYDPAKFRTKKVIFSAEKHLRN